MGTAISYEFKELNIGTEMPTFAKVNQKEKCSPCAFVEHNEKLYRNQM